MKNSDTNQNYKIMLSDRIFEFVEKLVQKYELEKDIDNEEEVKKRLKGAKTSLVRLGIKFLFSKKLKDLLEKEGNLESLPSKKLERCIESLIKKEISLKDFNFLLQKELNLSKEKTERLNKDIENNIPNLIKNLPNIKTKSYKNLKEKSTNKKDSYREPIK